MKLKGVHRNAFGAIRVVYTTGPAGEVTWPRMKYSLRSKAEWDEVWLMLREYS